MYEYFIGIDPGKKGGFALISNKVECAKAWDDNAFVDFVKNFHHLNVFAVVEKVSAMPGQGVTSMFTFGKSAGYIEGVLSAYGIPFDLVPPKRWKKEFDLDSDKQKSIDVAKKLFPNVDLKRTERCKTDSDGIAESLLMAEYAKRTYKGE